MSSITTENEVVAGTTQWLRGLWHYYREYTHTAVHAASAAALTAFGLLIFINRLFVILAIAAYIFPPIILYSVGSDIGRESDAQETTTDQPTSEARTDTNPNTNSDTGNGDTDSDGSDGDTDSDGSDGDTDSDSDDGDTDSDSDDGDTDSDGTDTDSDSDS
ncbi:hypothetical protein SAMN05421858_2965 [Haladaptatus litoreus]|uniref:Uncharacterized protein n=1 Tax=Haladaptatus litoreus TaxID=553468 RepID=A0A1N7C4R9_9EURY|nr:hypothetical protein [Haladaptatus litoreus]SIR58572.1 hypothetical protein SAMN05421858_2965 [Haladaptatus litoreus]